VLAWRLLFSLIFSIGLFKSQTAMASRVIRPVAPQTLHLDAIDFLSDDNLCGFETGGKLKCFDWNMDAVAVPDSIVGFAKVSDLVVSEIGVCGFDVDGLKCVQENRSKVKLRELIQDSVPGSVVARGYNACGISVANGTLRCLVSEWTSFSRHAFRIQPRGKITAIGVSDSRICWADDGLINCQNDGETSSIAFANADLIVTAPYLCARNATEAKCWVGGNVVTLAPEFLNAKMWFTDDYATLGAVTADSRFISADLNTGLINTTGSLHVPPEFEQPNGALSEVWAGDYQHFCAIKALASAATCWVGYAGAVSPVQFSEPVLGLIAGRRTPCALLQSGQIECTDEYSTNLRSLPAAGRLHARLRLDRTCVWNDKAIDCAGRDNFGAVEKILRVETDKEISALCAIIQRPGVKNSEVVCRQNAGLDTIPQATEGATSLSVATNRACAISPIGLTCWGKPYNGDAQPTSFLDPVKVQLGDAAACALDSFGLVCWGDLATHGLKIPSGLDSAGAVKDFALGENRTCAVLQDGTVQCWGAKQADDEDPPALTGVTAIYGSRQHVFCAANATGLHCWGGDTQFPR
jgi:hypothetical protein